MKNSINSQLWITYPSYYHLLTVIVLRMIVVFPYIEFEKVASLDFSYRLLKVTYHSRNLHLDDFHRGTGICDDSQNDSDTIIHYPHKFGHMVQSCLRFEKAKVPRMFFPQQDKKFTRYTNSC